MTEREKPKKAWEPLVKIWERSSVIIFLLLELGVPISFIILMLYLTNKL